MPWIWQDHNGGARTTRRRRRAHRRGGGQGGYARSYGRNQRSYSDIDNDDWDGNFYDQSGRRMNITIASPRDMMTPVIDTAERNTPGWPVNRSGYRQRF